MVTKVLKEVFQTSDGKVFESEGSANEHESFLKNVKYYEVRYGADLTEGRRWLDNVGYIAVNTKGSHFEFAEIALYKILGTEHQFCMGVFGSNAILPYWSLSSKPLETLDKNITVKFAVEDRFAEKKIYKEGIWDLRNKIPVKVNY